MVECSPCILSHRGRAHDLRSPTYTLRPAGPWPNLKSAWAAAALREKHSKLGAFWHTEFGPLNQVIHVYPYDDLHQRTAVRAALGQDTARAAAPRRGTLSWRRRPRS